MFLYKIVVIEKTLIKVWILNTRYCSDETLIWREQITYVLWNATRQKDDD